MNMKEAITTATNLKTTENGAIALSTTLNPIYDLFAFGGAYRNKKVECIHQLFQNAYLYDKTLALKCLFYLRDIREGQGERRIFREAMKWLAEHDPQKAKELLPFIPEYGRFDDLFVFFNTPIEKDLLEFLSYLFRSACMMVEGEEVILPNPINQYKQFLPLIFKWLPSIDTSSETPREQARKLANYLSLSPKKYRQILSYARNYLKIVERLMSDNRWNEIDFDKLPAKAALLYSSTFARRKETKARYSQELKEGKIKAKSDNLFPYDILQKLEKASTIEERWLAEMAWDNMPNFVDSTERHNILCVCDTSGSMEECGALIKAISLSIYFAERLNGLFHNKILTFSSHPKFLDVSQPTLLNKYEYMKENVLVDRTNLEAVFTMLLRIALSGEVKKEDFITELIILSDMEIDNPYILGVSRGKLSTTLDAIKENWESMTDYPFPYLYLWNLDARHNTLLSNDLLYGKNHTYLSGYSAQTFKNILSGKRGWDMVLDVLNSPRYVQIN